MTARGSPPLISCLMVTLADEQRLKLLQASVASYNSQTYQNKELIVVIDHSGDKERKALLSYLSSLGQRDVRCIVPDRKLSLGALRNLSMASAQGEVLCQWDDDDLSHPDRLTAQARFLKTNHYDAAILADNLHIFQYEGLCYWESGKRNLMGGRPSTLMLRNGCGLSYPESGPRSVRGENADFLKQLKSTCKVGYFEAPAFHYLYFFHGGNTMDSTHHRMLTMRTCVPKEQVAGSRERLVKGIKEVVGFDLPALHVMAKRGPLFSWSRSTDLIILEHAKISYRSRKILLFPAGKAGMSLVYSPSQSSLTKMATPLAESLLRMTDFMPLDEHAWDLDASQKRSASYPALFKDVLSGLAKEGLLISDEELKAKIKCQDEEASDQQSAIQSLGVPTCGRPETLHRCITGFLQNFREYGRAPRVIVADDSALPSQQMANQTYLEEHRKSFPEFEFSYAGLAEKRHYSELLARHSGVHPDIIEFGLFNPENLTKKACGPNRNALFLETVGERFLSVDDDVVCRPSVSPEIRHAIGITTVEDPTRVHLFPDRQALLNELPASSIDVLGVHESVLGKPLGGVFRSQPETPVTFGRLRSDFLNLLEKRAVRARVSWSGIYGDSGSRYPTYYLWRDDFTYKQLTESEEEYRRLSVSRQILRLPASLTFGAGGYCQSTALAYDHRTVLPPFMPLRGLDIVFGKILVHSYRDSVIAYLPSALLHSPPRAMSAGAEDITKAGHSVPYYAIVLSLIETHSPS